MTEENKYLSPLVSCLECRAIKSAKGIFSHFITAHTEKGNERAKSTLLKGSIKASSNKRLEKQSRKQDELNSYLKSPNICECGKPKPFDTRNNKFCSQSCGMHFTNIRKSYEVHQRRIEKLKQTLINKQKNGELQKICKFSYCVECNSIIKNKHSKTCSKGCLTNLLRKIGVYAGKCSASKRKDQKRSKAEIRLFELCKSHFKNITHNDSSIANGWDADILLYDFNVAILWNGPWHYKEMGFSNHSLAQVQNRDKMKIEEFQRAGWVVEIFEDRFYTPESAFEVLKLKYGSP